MDFRYHEFPDQVNHMFRDVMGYVDRYSQSPKIEESYRNDMLERAEVVKASLARKVTIEERKSDGFWKGGRNRRRNATEERRGAKNG